MNPATDTLYSIHIQQAKEFAKVPLSYNEFCERLRGQSDQDLLGLLLPQPDMKAPTPVFQSPKFDPGHFYITPNAASTILSDEVIAFLARHVCGDWGEMCVSDAVENECALHNGGRLVSTYRASNGQKFWIITEPDHAETTVLLPEDY